VKPKHRLGWPMSFPELMTVGQECLRTSFISSVGDMMGRTAGLEECEGDLS